MTERPEAEPDRPTAAEDRPPAEPDEPAEPAPRSSAGLAPGATPSGDEPAETAPRSSAGLAPGATAPSAEPTAAGPATTGVRLERLFEGAPDDQATAAPTTPVPPAADAEEPRRGPAVPRFSPRGRSRTTMERTPREPRRGFRVRRVRRLLRHVEPWSVLKIGLVFYLCVWGMTVIASQALWRTAETAGIIEKVERFIEELFALETFAFDTDKIFRLYVLAGLVLVIGGTALTVVLVVLFNLISDLMGGIRFTMIEEETAVRRRRVRVGEDVVPTEKVGRRRRPEGDGPHADG